MDAVHGERIMDRDVVVRSAPWPHWQGRLDVSAALTGFRFLRDYVLAFELISILLVIAMMGAVMVARKDRGGTGPAAPKAAP